MKNLFLISILLSIFFNSNAQVCLTPNVDYLTGSGTYNVLSADLNNDGFADLALPNESDNNISIFFGDGTGSFGTPVNIAATLPNSIHFGYFNADLFLDIAYTNAIGNEINILLNNGAGGFTAFATYISGGSGPRYMTSGDFNSDSSTDLLVVNYNNINMSLFLGNGLGSFTLSNTFSTEMNPFDITSADVNGDTFLDAILVNENSNNLSVMLGDGAGGFAARVNYPVSSLKPKAVEAFDLDGDGDKDLVAANSNTANISVLFNNGSGVFGSATTYNTLINSFNFDMSLADMNGDGKIDVVLACYWLNKVSILLGNGLGAFGSPIAFSTDIGPNYICTGDFNNDGKLDVAATNPSSNTMSVLLNNVVPVVHASASDTTLCEGTTISLNATGASTYSWSPSAANGASFYPTGTVTYTVTGTIAGCTDTDTLTITVHPLPTLTLVNTFHQYVCENELAILTATGNAVSYTWTGGVTNGVGFIPSFSNTSYTVTASSNYGCTRTENSYVYATPIPIPIITPDPNPACAGGVYVLNATGSSDNNGAVNGGLYSWTGPTPATPAGSAPNAISTTITASGTYTLVLTSNNLSHPTTCRDTITQTINFSPLPIVTASASDTLVCSGTQVTLNGAGANTYQWSGGVFDNTPFTINSPQTYSVTGTSNVGCVNTASVYVNVAEITTPAICMVTVDDQSNYNIVYWDKTTYLGADTFLVYRETSNNVYQIVGRVPYDSLSMFVDTVRAQYLPNTGDPEVSSNKYKLAIKDTCGNLSALSLYHATMFLQDQLNGNFNWSHYAVEGQLMPIPALTNYLFQRDNDLDGIFETTIGSLTGSAATDPSYFSFQNTADWRIETDWTITCNPTLRLAHGTNDIQTQIVRSKSNIKNQRTTGIKDGVNQGTKLKVYPNPAKEILNLEFLILNGEQATITIENMLGQVVYTMQTNKPINTINTSLFETGVYFVKVNKGKGVVVEKVIIE